MDPRQKIRRAHKYIDRLRVDVLFVAKAFSKGIISKYEHDILNNVSTGRTLNEIFDINQVQIMGVLSCAICCQRTCRNEKYIK